ncbi:PREDICTED: protocadherin alpha-12 [Odobenus rosmarus divergens]|uniref:Protocadherin alpha-12 n=1 Tax=Odobenus rosmarus divergens TaxID=9708 RepID=A0A2U3VRQ5_ODORO|nr:PREDICTED: protocadherin alpha-12 [Odobenus rosmarus divergens]
MVFSWRGGPGAPRLLLSLLLLAAGESGSCQVHYSVPEEAKHGTFVGRIAQDLGLELAELVPRLFRVASKGRRDLLEVNLQNGILFVNSRIDREELCGRSLECSIHLEVIMDRPLQVFHVEVEVKDINDNPPVFREEEQKVLISESAPLDSHFPLEGASDADIGVNSLLTYRLGLNEYFTLKIITKNDKSILPELVLRKSLDREETPELNILLTSQDGGKPELTGSVQIKISILDVNDNAPEFDKPGYKVVLFENVPNGTRVIQLNASDLDEGVNREISYGIRLILPVSEKCMFSINPETGEIRIYGKLDFEENIEYEIQVNAIDKGIPSMAGHCTVLVEVLDLNDNTPEVMITSLSLPMREDAQVGTVIALISVSDRDSGANGQVTCSLTPNEYFALDTQNNREEMSSLSLVLRKSLDREQIQEHSLLLTANDGGKPELTGTVQLLITILDVNDNAPEFDQYIYKVTVLENAFNGTLVIKLNATDLDDGTNGDIIYSFRKPVSPAVLHAFIINPNNGEIRTRGKLDFEKKKLYEISVEAIDKGNIPMAGHCTVLVEILDINDNTPEITITSLSLPVREDAQVGTVIALISVSDRDSGANGQLASPQGNPLVVGCKTKSGDIFCSSEMFFIELINIPISLQGTRLKTKLENLRRRGHSGSRYHLSPPPPGGFSGSSALLAGTVGVPGVRAPGTRRSAKRRSREDVLVSPSVFLAPPGRRDFGEIPASGEWRRHLPSPSRLPRLCTPRRRCAPPHPQLRFPRRLPKLQSGEQCFQPASPRQFQYIQEAERRRSVSL